MPAYAAQLALVLIVSALASVLSFVIQAVSGNGNIKLPGADENADPFHVLEPLHLVDGELIDEGAFRTQVHSSFALRSLQLIFSRYREGRPYYPSYLQQRSVYRPSSSFALVAKRHTPRPSAASIHSTCFCSAYARSRTIPSPHMPSLPSTSRSSRRLLSLALPSASCSHLAPLPRHSGSITYPPSSCGTPHSELMSSPALWP